MNSRTIFWRVFWKEYRLQRALWIAVAVLTMLVTGVGFVVVSQPDRNFWIFWIALAMPGIFPLGCGAVLFAGEHECGTFEYQKCLPVEAAMIYFVKMLFALTSWVVLFALMWFFAAFLSGWSIPESARWRLPLFLGASNILALFWTVLFSLLSRNVLASAVCGGIASLLTLLIATGALAVQDPTIAAMSVRIGVVGALVMLLDLQLGAKWFNEFRLGRSRAMLAMADSFSSACEKSRRRPKMRTVIGRLAWQHWRQLLLYGKIVLAVLAALILADCVFNHQMAVFFTGLARVTGPTLPSLFHVGIAMLAGSIFGVYTFHGDHIGGYRFLAERGVSPRLLWLSRQLLILCPIWLSLLVLEDVAFIAQLAWRDPLLCFYVICTSPLMPFSSSVVASICVGQLFSMFFRSAILAVFFSVMVSAILGGWNWLMSTWMLNFMWFWLPIPLAFLAATWLRAPYWLLDRKDWRAWLSSVAAIVVPGIAIVAGALSYRVFEIPRVDPGFSVAEISRKPTAEENKTIELYRQAIESITPRKTEKKSDGDAGLENKTYPNNADVAWVEANKTAIEFAVIASKDDISLAENGRLEQSAILKLGELVIYRAAMLEKEGKLEQSLNDYLAGLRIAIHLRKLAGNEFARHIESFVFARLPQWAAHKGQTVERIKVAITELDGLTGEGLAAICIKNRYFYLKRAIENCPQAIDLGYFNSAFAVVWLKLPWERERALRLLDQETLSQLTMASCMEKAVRRGECFAWSFYSDNRFVFVRDFQARDWWWIVKKGVPCREDFSAWQCDAEVDFAVRETSRRAAQLILAVEGWRLLHHGKLPERLEELKPLYFDRLPTDPLSGSPFLYFREGVHTSLDGMHGWPDVKAGSSMIDKNAPFIWSTSPNVKLVSRLATRPDSFEVYCESGGIRGWHKRNQWLDIWDSGWPFAIP